jgi:DNA polymerase-3 subunit alpha
VCDDNKKEHDALPSMNIDFENINLECKKTWDLFIRGETKGVFQLEKSWTHDWSRKMKPSNVEDASALISLIRPGCLEAKDRHGKSMTDNYVDRKSGIPPQYNEEEQKIADILEPILGETYGVLVYQEQAMKIAVDIGGFNEQDADVLRKAIGKKKPELMAKVRSNFIEKCKSHGIVDEKESEIIFDMIEKSQRYSFNKSHAVAYATMGYWSAYVKAHFPLHYICSWLHYSRNKQDTFAETNDIVSDARGLGIDVNPPILTSLFSGDEGDVCIHNQKVYLGVRNIKRIGDNHISKMIDKIRETEEEIGISLADWSWMDFLTKFSNKVGSAIIIGIISSGGLLYMNKSRHAMLYEYNCIWKEMTKKEQEYFNTHFPNVSLEEGIEHMIYNYRRYSELTKKDKDLKSVSNANRFTKIKDLLDILKNPPISMKDSPEWIVNTEKELLGTPVTISKLDICENNMASTTCKEVKNGHQTGSIGVEIKSVRTHMITSGKNKNQLMAFLSVEDDSSGLDSVIAFSNIWSKYSRLLREGNTVLLTGHKSDRGGFIIENVVELL